MMGETGGNDMNAAVSGNKSVEEIKALVPAIVEAIMQATRVSYFILCLFYLSKCIEIDNE